MKKLYVLASFAGLTLLPLINFAQCLLSISGDTCGTGNQFTADFVGGDLQSLTWKLNGTTAYVATKTGYNPLPSTEAIIDYGNCVFVAKNGLVYTADSPTLIGTTKIQRLIPGSLTPLTLFTVGYQVDAISVIRDTMYILGSNPSILQKVSLRDYGAITIAGEGTGIKLQGTWGLFVDNRSNVYVSLNGPKGGKVQALNQRTGRTSIVAGNNGYGSADNQIAFAKDVWVDDEGNVYVLDLDNARIQKWVPGATSGITVAGGNGQGTAENQFLNPWKMFVDSNKNIYVCDQYAKRVTRWKEGDSTGTTIAGGYGIQTEKLDLVYPRDLSMDKDGAIWVADGLSNRILKFSTSNDVYTGFFPSQVGVVTASALASSGCEAEANSLTVNPIAKAPYYLYAPRSVVAYQKGVSMYVDSSANQTYFWELPEGCTIVSGQYTAHMVADWGANGGRVSVYGYNSCGKSPTAVSKKVNVVSGRQNSFSSEFSLQSPERSIGVFPNPFQEFLTVQLSSIKGGSYMIFISDAKGTILLKSEGTVGGGNNEIRFNTINLKSGTYFLNFQLVGQPIQKKVVVKY